MVKSGFIEIQAVIPLLYMENVLGFSTINFEYLHWSHIYEFVDKHVF